MSATDDRPTDLLLVLSISDGLLLLICHPCWWKEERKIAYLSYFFGILIEGKNCRFWSVSIHHYQLLFYVCYNFSSLRTVAATVAVGNNNKEKWCEKKEIDKLMWREKLKKWVVLYMQKILGNVTRKMDCVKETGFKKGRFIIIHRVFSPPRKS